MLEFFRKYQRYFFIFIAILLVISLSFFGTQHLFNAPPKEKDRCVGIGVDGSKMMKSELDQMVRFLASDRNDLALAEKGVMPNFLNDGVIRKDLLGTGIGIFLVKAYFGDLKEELTERMVHHKAFVPYVHPSAPFISVENLWSQVLPSQKEYLNTFLHETKEMDFEAFSLLVNLYLGESAFPPNIMREYLTFQQRHYNWVEPDPALERMNLNVFHCRSLEEWFGPRFIELVAQFVLNAQMIAKEKGYRVSFEEARVNLIQNGYEALKTHFKKEEVSEEEIGKLWQQQLYILGMTEKEVVYVWQKVMLFRRLFEDVGGAVFVDPHMYQTFYNFASKSAEVDLYHLPESLELKDFSSLMKLQFYLDQVAKNREKGLFFPRSFASVTEVEKRCPQLVEQRFLVEVASVKKDEIAAQVSLSNTWEWQLERENFSLLEENFPQLAMKKSDDAEGYFAALENLSDEVRAKVDRFTRGKIVEGHPEWIQEALNQKHFNTKSVNFSSDGEVHSFEGISSGKTLLQLFSRAALKGELESDPEALAAKNQLELYSEDGETYFRFHVVERDLSKTILTFAEAHERGILDTLLQKHLEISYPKIRTKNPTLFKTTSDAWKPLSEVEEKVGKILYGTLLNQIDQEVSGLGVSLPEDRRKDLDTFYPQYFFFPYMHLAEKDIRRVGESSLFLKAKASSLTKKLEPKQNLEEQWTLTKENILFKNHEPNPWFSSDLFSMVEKSWSNVGIREKGRLFFFQLLEKSVPAGNFQSEMKQGRAILSKEAERHLMKEMVSRIQEANGIQLSHDSPERP